MPRVCNPLLLVSNSVLPSELAVEGNSRIMRLTFWLLLSCGFLLNKLPDEEEKRIRALFAKGMNTLQLPDDICEEMEKAAIRNDR